MLGGVVLSVGVEECVGFDGVAEGGAGAVGFDGVDLVGGEVGVGEGLVDDAFLGGAVGCGESVAGAVLVDGGSGDEGEDGAALCLGVAEALEDDDAGAFGPAGAVGFGGEGFAAAVGGEAALAAEFEEGFGGGHDGGAAGEGEGAFVVAEGLAGEVDGDEGGGAGGVDGEGGSVEAEGVGDAAGGDGGGGAGQEVALQLGVALGAVAVGGEAGEDAGASFREVGRGDAGVLECLPGNLQEESLLGVHGFGFAGGDVEERGVELIGVVQEPAAPCHRCPGPTATGLTGNPRALALVGAPVFGSVAVPVPVPVPALVPVLAFGTVIGVRTVRIEQPVKVPTTVCGKVADRVPALGGQLPE